MAGGRTSASFFAASTSLTGPVRVAEHYSFLLVGRGKQKFVSQHALAGVFALKAPIRNSFVSLGGAVAVKAPERVGGNYLVSVQSYNRAFYPILFGPDNDIYGITEFEWQSRCGANP
jgi:hypothetical protein